MTRTEYRLQDLAARKRAEHRIRQLRRALIHASHVGVIVPFKKKENAWWWNLGQVPSHLDMAIAAFRYGQEGEK